MRTIRTIAVLGTALVVSGGIGPGTAHADPPTSSLPAVTDIVGVGDGTTAPLFSGSPAENSPGSLSYDYNHQSPAPASKLWSWDPVNPVTGQAGDEIVTKGSSSGDATCEQARPDGSAAGLRALRITVTDNGHPCIDFARYTGLSSGDVTDLFLPMARDAIDWSYPKVAGQLNPQPASLNLTQLNGIYNCTITDWSQVGGGHAPIVAVLPQSGSGIRSRFLAAIGVTTPGSCVVNGTINIPNDANNPVPPKENTGVSPSYFPCSPSNWAPCETGNAYEFATHPNAIFPYSVGDWIAQTTPAVKGTGAAGTPGGATVGGHASPVWGHGNLQLGLYAGVAPVTMNTYGQWRANPAWTQTFNYTVDNVLPCVLIPGCNPRYPPNQPPYNEIFAPTGWICTSPAAQSDTVSYGLGLLGSSCGNPSAGGG